MDEKLARGLAREAFYKLPAVGDLSGGVKENWGIVLASYRKKGLTSHELKRLIESLETQSCADPSLLLVSSRYLPLARKGLLRYVAVQTRKSPTDDGSSTSSTGAPAEKWEAVLVSTQLVLKSKKVDLIERVVPLSLPFHVAHRFIEREEAGFDDLLRQLPRVIYFSYIFSSLFGSLQKLFPVVFPIGSGLLLGRTAEHNLYTDGIGYGLDSKSRVYPARTAHSQVRSPQWLGAGRANVTGCEFITYISSQQMRDDQRAIYDELIRMFSSDIFDLYGRALLTDSSLEPMTCGEVKLSAEHMEWLEQCVGEYVALCASDRYAKSVFAPAASHMPS
jgi:hypothetical protein